MTAIRVAGRLGQILAAMLGIMVMAACVAEQPESARTVAAYEVPLETKAEKDQFIQLLRERAEAHGFHVDAATDEQLAILSEVSPITMNVTVWKGKDDDEPVASAMDFKDHIGRVWISFSLGSEPARFQAFREDVVPLICHRWPDTMTLPIMPNGSIPLARDLMATRDGYVVNPSSAANYDVRRPS